MLFANDFKVFDIHGHLPYPMPFLSSNEIHQARNSERSRQMRLTWDFPEGNHAPDDDSRPLADRWIESLDAHNIGGINFLTAANNDELSAQIARHPHRLTGFAHHAIESPDARDELVRAVDELGLRGYKIFAPMVQIPFHDPTLQPVWTFLAERRLPVLIHFGLLGHTGGIVQHANINPLAIFNVARQYPTIPIIIPHFGAGYFQELLHLCWGCPNIYIDTSGSNQWIRWTPYELTLEHLFRKTYELIGPERIIFGTDSNSLPRGFINRYLQEQVRIARELRFREEEIEAIFGNNARHLLGLPQQ
ncbi:amidohydrolase family protein [Paenibacillus sp. CAU 1782]